MPALCNQLVRREGEPASFAVVAQKPAQLIDHFICICEIRGCLELLAEYLPVFFRFFHQQAGSYGRRLKSAHRMPVSVSLPHQTERDLRSADGFTRCLRIRVPSAVSFCFPEPRPISAI